MGKRDTGIEALLIWAFQRECAQLEHPDLVHLDATFMRRAVGTEHRIAEIAALGADVDGGGRSLPHHDADAVAIETGRLPWHLAVRVADHARSGRRPIGNACAVPRPRPAEWVRTPHGMFGRKEVCDTFAYISAKGVRKRRETYWCPVKWLPTWSQIDVCRDIYREWWRSLWTLRVALDGKLDRWALTDDMPPVEPWRDRGGGRRIAA